MATAPKVSKVAAHYRPGPPHCGACKYFSEDEDDESEPEKGWCQKVSGEISEDDVCDLFEKRNGYEGR